MSIGFQSRWFRAGANRTALPWNSEALATGRRPLWVAASAAATVLSLLTLGCEGFFVDPVLTGLTVGPSVTIQTGNTLQMSAVGSYNDGTQKTITSKVYWSSGTPSIATINGSGMVTGLEPGQATITGASGTVTGTATVTVAIGGLVSITVSTQDGLTNIPFGNTEQFVATGVANGQQIVVTNSVTWSTSPSSIDGVSIASTTGVLTTTSGPSTPVQFQVVATDPITGISGKMPFTVHP